MISKTDLLTLLTDLEDKGFDASKQMMQLIKSENISLEILQFINTNRPLEIVQFYEHLRKNHNIKKSPLYKNIVIEELKNPEDAIVILSALLLQINLFASKLDDSQLFLSCSRATEITSALNNYYTTLDLIPCLKLLKLIKIDLKVFEGLNK